MKCHECGASMGEKRITHRYTESGLDNVYLGSVSKYTCTKCKESMVVIPRPIELGIVIAIGLMMKPALLSGSEIRYLRKEVGMNGKTFAEAIGVSSVTLSRWENKETQQTESHDKLIRYAFRIMLQKKIRAIIDNIESTIKRAEIMEIKKERIDIDVDQLKYVSILEEIPFCEYCA